MKKTLHLNPDYEELKQFFYELREQGTYPIVHGDPLLHIYDLLCVLGVNERVILDLFGVRGYLHVARNRYVEPAMLDKVLSEVAFGGQHDEEAGSQ